MNIYSECISGIELPADTAAAELEEMATSYAECALWAEDDESGAFDGITVFDADKATIARIVADCAEFCNKTGYLLMQDGQSYRQAGIDLWLTRNGHGAGFWDGDWPEHGEFLTELANQMGEIDIMVDDGQFTLFPYK